MAVSGLVAISIGWVVVGSNASTSAGVITADVRGAVARLPDGSKMSLRAHSRVRVEATRQQNVAVLDRGEVILEVARDAPRPVIVRAADATAAASAGSKLRVAMNVVIEFELLEGETRLYLSRAANAGAGVITLKKGVPYRVPMRPTGAEFAPGHGSMDALLIDGGIIETNREVRAIAVRVPISILSQPYLRCLRMSNEQHTQRHPCEPDRSYIGGECKDESYLI